MTEGSAVAQEPEHTRPRLRATVLSTLLFVAVGPPVGLGLLFLFGERQPDGGTTPLAAVVYILVIFSYVMGAPGALLTGAAVGAVAPDPRNLLAYPIAALAGAATPILWVILVSHGGSIAGDAQFGWIGAGSGVICAGLRQAIAGLSRRRRSA